MTIKELIEQLEKLDENMEVLMSSDEEGNSFDHLYSAQVEKCIDYQGEWEVMADEDYEDLDAEDKLKAKDYLVLWP